MSPICTGPLVPVFVLACAALTWGCRSSFTDAYGEAEARNLENRAAREPKEERVIVRDPVTKNVLEDRRVVMVDGVAVANEGLQRTFYRGGEPETLRSFIGGEPAGVWWSWWRTGALRSAYLFDADRATRMTWWHPNGLVASEGLARAGSREGPWRFFQENGRLESEGQFLGGKRHGAWTLYGEDGEWAERGAFTQGVRTGEWSRSPTR